jgi:hypothetical protein
MGVVNDCLGWRRFIHGCRQRLPWMEAIHPWVSSTTSLDGGDPSMASAFAIAEGLRASTDGCFSSVDDCGASMDGYG